MWWCLNSNKSNTITQISIVQSNTETLYATTSMLIKQNTIKSMRTMSVMTEPGFGNCHNLFRPEAVLLSFCVFVFLCCCVSMLLCLCVFDRVGLWELSQPFLARGSPCLFQKPVFLNFWSRLALRCIGANALQPFGHYTRLSTTWNFKDFNLASLSFISLLTVFMFKHIFHSHKQKTKGLKIGLSN